MPYHLSAKSRAELKGVHPRLKAVVEAAITDCPVDFAVHDGLRTIEEQREYVRKGVSKTMKSKHLEGRAVDLVPVINGKLRWEEGACRKVAAHVLKVAKKMGVGILNGGTSWGWDWPHFELLPSEK